MTEKTELHISNIRGSRANFRRYFVNLWNLGVSM